MDSDKFKNLISKIDVLLSGKESPIVAISGYGGAGKSTLTDKIAEHYKIESQQVIRVDNLYAKNFNSPGFFEQFDWDLLEQILRDVREIKKLNYVGKSFLGDNLEFNEPLPKLILVEGVRLIKPRFMPYFDLSIWLDCPQEIAIARAKERDRSQGDSEEAIARWDTDWAPKDKVYFDEYRPDLLSNILF